MQILQEQKSVCRNKKSPMPLYCIPAIAAFEHPVHQILARMLCTLMELHSIKVCPRRA